MTEKEIDSIHKQIDFKCDQVSALNQEIANLRQLLRTIPPAEDYIITEQPMDEFLPETIIFEGTSRKSKNEIISDFQDTEYYIIGKTYCIEHKGIKTYFATAKVNK